jgi:hypothetical protein
MLDIAGEWLESAVPGTRGLWPRAVAFMIRMELEKAVDAFWASKVPALRDCSMRAQLLCLREYTDSRVAARADAVWGALSSACHYHHYELVPTAAELRAWHDEVRGVVQAITKQ